VTSGRGVVRLAWAPKRSGDAKWEARFQRAPMINSHCQGTRPYMVGRRSLDPWTEEVYWVSYGSPAGFSVKMDGVLLGYAFSNRVRLGALAYRSRHAVEVGVADLTGVRFPGNIELPVTAGDMLPEQIHLSDLLWETATSGYRMVLANGSVGGVHLTTAGKPYAKGLGTHPDSRIVYDLKGVFRRLTGRFGIEDQNGAPEKMTPAQKGRAVFRVEADGRELLAATEKVHGQPPSDFDLDVTRVRRIELIVEQPGDGERSFAPHANWLDVKAAL
jgi:hypothetical protein